MQRFGVLGGVCLCFALVVVAATGGWALPNTDHLNAEVSGSFTGRQSFTFSTPSCPFVEQLFDGNYESSGGEGTLHVDVCVTAAAQFEYAGTFTIHPPHGGVLTGTVSGSTDAAVPVSSLTLTLVDEFGTRAFQHVTGTIVLTGHWSNDEGVLGSGPATGTLAGQLERVTGAP